MNTQDLAESKWGNPPEVTFECWEGLEVEYDRYGSPITSPDNDESARYRQDLVERGERYWPAPDTTFQEWVFQPKGIASAGDDARTLFAVASKAVHGGSGSYPEDALAARAHNLQVGDIGSVRAACVRIECEYFAHLSDVGKMSHRTAVEALASVRATLDSEAFYLGPDSIEALLETDMPDEAILDEIHLPFDAVMVCFPAFCLDDVDGGSGNEDERLVGAILWSRPDGSGLADTYHSIRVSRAGAVETLPYMRSSPGLWKKSAFAPVIANIAALLTWGSWDDPQPGPSLPANPTALRKMIRTSAFRKAVRNGSFDGTRVIDIASVTTRRGPDQGGTHASPRAHLRRGHWRRVRTGINGGPVAGPDAIEGQTFARTPRRIAPTIVGQAASVDPTARTYKVTPR